WTTWVTRPSSRAARPSRRPRVRTVAVAILGDGLRRETSSPGGSRSTTPPTPVGSGPRAFPSPALRTGVACCAMAQHSQKPGRTRPARAVTVTYRRIRTPVIYARRGYSAEMTSQSIANTPTQEQIRRAPKVLLHDHLDGGLRPGTVVDLARDSGYDRLPETDADKLGLWFREAADSGSLERYLETFSHTVGVMQTRDALVRVAAECAEDLAEDGVVYAEVRYAPEQHLE